MSNYKEVTVTRTFLQLGDNGDTLLLNINDKQVRGWRLPNVGGNTFNYDTKNRYRFGCGTGAFNYDTLLKTIAEAQADTKSVIEGLKPKKGGNSIKSEVISESDDFFITKSGRAYAKDKYDKAKITVDSNKSFGKFIWQQSNYHGAQYVYSGHNAGSKVDILAAMLQAKAIIEYVEGIGEFAPKKEEDKVVDTTVKA